ncbi:hypothetical protein NDU88_005241 [Pleurodeles waltl]|uniref:Uncharacterized protein n=1 Tax=Pleurodeles waltl TaxID=8319 RepID=A0AAV7VKY3_PLEWA|nr:hypothetical protein NDU88_005241 [Pleurodeles waltl]
MTAAYSCQRQVEEQEAARPAYWPRSGESEALPGVNYMCTWRQEDLPFATIEINWTGHEEYLSVGVIPDLGEDMIIGTDTEAFPQLLDTANQDNVPVSWWEEAPFVSSNVEGSSPRRKLSKAQKRMQKQLYQKETITSNTPVPDPPKAIMSTAGQFQQAQREDPTLKNAWQISLSPDDPSVGPTFKLTNEVLYRECPDSPDRKPQLVVPQSYREQVLHLAHQDNGEGHQARVRNRRQQDQHTGHALGRVWPCQVRS